MQEDSDCALLQGIQRASLWNILWHESKGKKPLKCGIDEGMHLYLKPSMTHAMRVEYKVFPFAVIRNHIYQEVDSPSAYTCYGVHVQEKLETEELSLNPHPSYRLAFR